MMRRVVRAPSTDPVAFPRSDPSLGAQRGAAVRDVLFGDGGGEHGAAGEQPECKQN